MNIIPKIVGHCSVCDKLVFDVTARYEDEPRHPKQLGAPQPDARRVTFLLASGEMMDLTFCEDCTQTLNSEEYGPLWNKVLVSWIEELGDTRPTWFLAQMHNAILCELGVQDWNEIMRKAN